MNVRTRLSGALIGGLALIGGVAAGPGDTPADPPPEAEEGCKGIQEAEGENGGDGEAGDTAASDVLDQVEALLDAENDSCDDHEAASGEDGRP